MMEDTTENRNLFISVLERFLVKDKQYGSGIYIGMNEHGEYTFCVLEGKLLYCCIYYSEHNRVYYLRYSSIIIDTTELNNRILDIKKLQEIKHIIDLPKDLYNIVYDML